MNIKFCQIRFGDTKKIHYAQNHKIEERFDDNGILDRRIEYDALGRDIDSKQFDNKGNIISHLHKDYYEKDSEKGYIETYKDTNQEYTRKTYTKFEDSIKRNVDEYTSKSNPKASYINEFIYDLSGKLLRILNNKKEINL